MKTIISGKDVVISGTQYQVSFFDDETALVTSPEALGLPKSYQVAFNSSLLPLSVTDRQNSTEAVFYYPNGNTPASPVSVTYTSYSGTTATEIGIIDLGNEYSFILDLPYEALRQAAKKSLLNPQLSQHVNNVISNLNLSAGLTP